MDLDFELLVQPNWTAKFLLDCVSIPRLTLPTPSPPKQWTVEELTELYFPILWDIITSEVRERDLIPSVILQCGAGRMIQFELRGIVLELTPPIFSAMLEEIFAGGVITEQGGAGVLVRLIYNLEDLRLGHWRIAVTTGMNRIQRDLTAQIADLPSQHFAFLFVVGATDLSSYGLSMKEPVYVADSLASEAESVHYILAALLHKHDNPFHPNPANVDLDQILVDFTQLQQSQP